MFIRLKRLNNNHQDYIDVTNQMFTLFLNRGYARRTLKRIMDTVNKGPYSLLDYKHKTKLKNNKTPAVITYHKNFRLFGRQLAEMYNTHLDTLPLYSRNKATSILRGPCMTAYRRSRNLKDLLVKSKLSAIT